MGWLQRAAPAMLLHVNLWLMMYAGAALATAARLTWDPTAYVAARELFPREHRAACAALPALALTLLLLAHGAAAALRCRRAPRRALLILYASMMLVVLSTEVSLGAWAAWRVARWARGPQADELRQHALALRDHLRPLLEHLAHYHPLPEKVNRLVQEAEADLPRNVRVLVAAAALLAALQLLAAALALLAAGTAPPHRASDATDASDTTNTTADDITPLNPRRGDAAKTPLRAVYRDGRLLPAGA